MGTVKYSGPVASFHCPTEATIRSLKVHFSPKQLGEGTPSPENVREIVGWDGVEVEQSGKNLYSIEKVRAHGHEDWDVIMTGNKSKVSISNYNRWTFVNTAVPKAKYTYLPNCYEVGFLDAGENVLNYYMGWNQYVITAPDNACYIYLTWYKNGTNTAEAAIAIHNQMYLTFSDTTIENSKYESYHGSTINYEFGVLGKNKFDYASTTFIQGIRGNDGEFISDSVSHYTEQFIPVIPATEYTLSGNNLYSGGYVVRIYYSDANKNWISKTSGDRTNTLTFTTPSDCYYIQIQTNSNGTNPETWQLELGSAATTYEPYDPNKTVYGGWVDLVSGEVCEEYSRFAPDENSYITIIKNDTFSQFRFQDAEAIKTRLSGYCSHFKLYANPNVYGETALDYLGTACQLILQQDSSVYVETVADLKSWLQAQREAGTPFHIVFERAEPNYYNLPPHSSELKTFLSTNNVWSNADYVEIEYDLHETQNILARKQLIVANQPHIVKPTAAPLQNFVTDMAAPLKECKVHFEPVQEGTGDPSPDNVRPISGFEEIKLLQCKENLWNKETATPQYINSGSGLSASDANNLTSNWIEVIPNKTYIYSYQPIIGTNISSSYSGLWTGAGFYKTQSVSDTATARKTWLASSSTNIQQIEITIPENCYYIRIGSRHLNIDGAWACFEPYEQSQITSTPINWSDSLGTIYGGYVDLVTGEVVQEWYTISIDETVPMRNYTADARNQGTYCEASYWLSTFNASNATGYEPYSTDGYCNILPYIENNYTNEARASASNSVSSVCLSGVKTQEEYLAWIAEHGPVVICYRLATPIHYPLTPTQLKTLRGTNNVWSNANGDLEIAYWTH